MFGNLMNNVLIERFVTEGLLQIHPFDRKRLQVAQYPLSPLEIIFESDARSGTPIVGRHHLEEEKKPYKFQAREYAIVTVREHIILPDGIVARFIPASGLIESGYGLTAGKLDPGYGDKGEQIRFGLQNLRDYSSDYSKDSPLAYIEFFDLRGLPTERVASTDYDKLIRLMRLADSIESYPEMVRQLVDPSKT